MTTATTSQTHERMAPDLPGHQRLDLAAKKTQADAKAREARAAADRAAKVAKDAKAAARAADIEAAKLHAETDPKEREREERGELSLAQAKQRLLDAGRAIDPIGSLRETVREHPYATVGSAAGAGFVIGSSRGLVGRLAGAAASLALSAVKLGKPLALAAGQFAASRAAAQQAAGQAAQSQAAS